MDYEGFLQLVKQRRSIRRFKPDPVPDEYVEKIIEAARWAPSGANSQPWEFLVVKDQETKDKIVDIVNYSREQTYLMEQTREERLRHPNGRNAAPENTLRRAPVFILLLGDPRTNEAFILSALYHHEHANFISGLSMAFYNMHLAASGLGLGSRWITATSAPYGEAMIKQLLGIPKPLKIYDTMALGYADQYPRPRLVRSLSEQTHHERYDMSKYRSDKQVEDWIAEMFANLRTAR